jgi:outer membrane protein assembly factor BamB
LFIPVLREGKLSVAALSLQTGGPVWEKTYDDLLYPDFGPWMRFSLAAGDGRVFLSVTKGHDFWQYGTGYPRQTGATLTVDPETGGVLWQNKEYSIDHQTRMMYRKGMVVVFDTKGSRALDAHNGRLLWDGPGMNKKAYHGCYFFQPLSDAFLESKGRRGVVHSDGCEYPVFINGLWYGHIRAQGHATVAREEVATPDADGITVSKEIWRHPFLGRACPSPAPAYGRLYFSPNSEGVVYCFENTTQEQSGTKSP